jgi:ubiquinone/menaquinone biosynthesis C-methylase UbiE
MLNKKYYHGKRNRWLIKYIPFIHNKIKENLYKKYTNSPILELSGGRGGDIYKYKLINAKEIYFVDIDEDAIKTAKEKYENLYKQDFKMHFYVRNISKPLKLNIKQVKTVSMHFAIHYFLKSRSTIKTLVNNIDKYLKVGGSFISTFLNGRKVFDMLKEKNIIARKKRKTMYYIKRIYNQNEKFHKYGQKIKVFFSSIGTHDEYLVNINYLIDMFGDNYKVVYNKQFNPKSLIKKDINRKELIWINLNHILVLKKIK